jgi:aspartate/methionine/tyrosine aminotransferase
LPHRLKIAARSQVAPFIAMDVLARANAHAAAGRDVIHLEVGEPGRGAPARVLEAARRALDGGPIGYTEALGRPALRAAIAEHYRHSYDLTLDPAQVVVTVGASGAFVLGFLAMFDPGDRVIVPEPAFPAYKNILRALGIEVVRSGFSKYFCMTGWRLGWLIVPPDLVRPIELLAQNLFISPPALAQEAALAAFACRDELDQRVETYRRSRAALLDCLPRGRLDRFAPVDGAFYLYVDVSHLTEDSHTLCAAILEGAGVALTPGADFDGESGHRYLRLAFAGEPDQVIRGAERLTAWLNSRI